MALGGGTFVSQNKTLPGAYINVISARTSSSAAADRGVAAIALSLDWGPEGEMITIINTDFTRNAKVILGYSATHEKLKPIREIFLHANKLYVFRANKGGAKAKNTIATAKYSGVRGNALKTVVTPDSLEETASFTVETYLENELVDTQRVKSAEELAPNDFVIFDTSATLAQSAGEALAGGSNGETAAHEDFLAMAESYPDINAIGYAGTDDDTKKLYSNHVISLRNDYGIKMQTVVFGYKADSEAVVNVKNCAELVYWVLGVVAGTAVNVSALNAVYDGFYDIPAAYTQSELEDAINAGEFTLHRVGSDLRVLADINSLVTVTNEKDEIFKDNQTVRVADSIATSVASIFNTKYLGRVPNDASGRESFWGDVVSILKSLRDSRAIEDFNESEIIVVPGNTKNNIFVWFAVDLIGTMARLYMTCVVS